MSRWWQWEIMTGWQCGCFVIMWGCNWLNVHSNIIWKQGHISLNCKLQNRAFHSEKTVNSAIMTKPQGCLHQTVTRGHLEDLCSILMSCCFFLFLVTELGIDQLNYGIGRFLPCRYYQPNSESADFHLWQWPTFIFCGASMCLLIECCSCRSCFFSSRKDDSSNRP